MSIKSSSLITDDLRLDDTKPTSVKTAPDRTADQAGGSDGAHARDGLVAPPGLLTHHARTRISSLSRLLVDLQNSMAINQHYWVATGKRAFRSPNGTGWRLRLLTRAPAIASPRTQPVPRRAARSRVVASICAALG